jgi:AAHS family 3-hydroxyphenylpropionic acid transporter
MPTLISLVAEVAGGRKTTAAVTTIIVGQPLGGIISALTGRTLAEAYGWQSLFLVGGLLTLAMVPVMLKMLPETKPATPGATAQRMPLATTLFAQGRARPTVLLWLIFILTLALLSILLSWTPLLVMGKGFPRPVGLNAIVAINAGGIAGGLVISRLIDRYGVRWPMLALYALMTAGLYLLAQAQSIGPIMVFAFLTGFAVLGAQFTLYGVSPQLYPLAGRGSAVGVAVAMGRVGSIIGPLAVGGMLAGGSHESEVLMVMAPVALISGAALFVMTMSASFVTGNAKPA